MQQTQLIIMMKFKEKPQRYDGENPHSLWTIKTKEYYNQNFRKQMIDMR